MSSAAVVRTLEHERMLVTLRNWTTDARILAAALRTGLASEAGLLALANAAEHMDERMVAAALYLFVKDKKVRGEVVKHVQGEMGPSTTYRHAAKSVRQLREYILLEYFRTEGIQ